MPDLRELKIPKTFLELEGNELFNYDPSQPEWGHGVKRELPPGPLSRAAAARYVRAIRTLAA